MIEVRPGVDMMIQRRRILPPAKPNSAIALRLHSSPIILRRMNELGVPASAILHSCGKEQAELHERATHAAHAVFGRKVFVRAVAEISNFCREDCQYCGMRRSNRLLKRYRARVEALADLLIHHCPASVTDINLQAGEDPVAVREVALPLIQELRKQTNLGISVCLGTLDGALFAALKDAGATINILKFELANPARYERLQAPGTLAERVEAIHLLAGSGWHVSSGFIAGLPGLTESDLLENFALARSLPLRGCSVSPFIPGEETPLVSARTADPDLTLNCMAALRLMRPDWVIPAVSALNLAQPGTGYSRGLHTGANLVTINLTPAEWQKDYVLYKRDRFIMTEERILNEISRAGLTPSTQSLADYFNLHPAQNLQPARTEATAEA
jgi:biotin synthase